MYHRKPAAKKTELDAAITNAISELGGHEAHTENYANVVDQVVKLHALKSSETPDRVSKDTLAIVAGNLAGILMIVSYEHKNVITSKAMTLIGKLK